MEETTATPGEENVADATPVEENSDKVGDEVEQQIARLARCRS
jgi:hypothetical protein